MNVHDVVSSEHEKHQKLGEDEVKKNRIML